MYMYNKQQSIVGGRDCMSYKDIAHYPCGDQVAGKPCKYNKVLNDCLPPSLLTLKHNKNSCGKYFLVDDAYPGGGKNCLTRSAEVPSGCESKCSKRNSCENFEKNCGFYNPEMIVEQSKPPKMPGWCYKA
jgi:hypothetical protein